MAFSWYQKFWIQTFPHPTTSPALSLAIWPAPRAWISGLQTPVAQSWPAQHQNSVRPPKNVKKGIGVAGVRRGKRENWKPSLLLGGLNRISTTKPCYLMGVQLPKPQLIFSPDFWTINTIKQSDIWLLVSANPLEKICSSKWGGSSSPMFGVWK